LAQDKVYVDSSYRRAKNQSKIEQDEKELEELLKQSKGEDDKPEEESKEEPQEEPQEENKEDEPEVKESKEDEEDEDKELDREEKTFKKRYGDLRRHMAKREEEWKEELEKAKSQKDVKPPKSDEDIEAWAKQYPDIAGIVETIAQKKAQELFSKADDRLREFDEAQYEVSRTKAENTIRKTHEDFDELKASDEFHDWAEEQPKWVQDALYENADDAASVIRVIDLYKVDKGLTTKATREKTKDAAKVVKTSTTPKVDPDEGGKKIRESDVAKMSDKEFEEQWDEIQKAQRNGDFVYDLSGGAR